MPRRIFKTNPVRSTMALPPDVNLDDVDWVPGMTERVAFPREENRRAAIGLAASLPAKWAAEELAYYKRKYAALDEVVAADRAWIARQNQLEAELKKIQDYYNSEHDEENRARLVQLTKVINKDICKTEREALLRRGVVRGRRKS